MTSFFDSSLCQGQPGDLRPRRSASFVEVMVTPDAPSTVASSIGSSSSLRSSLDSSLCQLLRESLTRRTDLPGSKMALKTAARGGADLAQGRARGGNGAGGLLHGGSGRDGGNSPSVSLKQWSAR
eukprot:scaffold248741_cov23-Tisochrysis_lutea.AAC.3